MNRSKTFAKETQLGLFVAFALVALVFIVEMSGGSKLIPSGNTFRARFDSAKELRIGSQVKLAGVRVGRVTDIRIADRQVEVEMSVDKDAQVRTDSQATIGFAGMLGEQFVTLTFGSPNGAIAENGAILESTDSADLNDLMQRIDSVAVGVENITKTFSGDSLGDLLTPLSDFVRETKPQLTNIFSNIDTVTTSLAEGKGTLGRLVTEDELHNQAQELLTTLQENLTKATGDIETIIADARGLISDIQEGKGSIGRLMVDDTLVNETEAAMVNLKEILQKINSGTGAIGELVNDASFLDNLKLTLRKVENATESLEDTGPLSIINNAAGSLF